MEKIDKVMLNLSSVTTGKILSPLHNDRVLIPEVIKSRGITQFQGKVIEACSSIIKNFDNTYLFITSTDVTYRGTMRTSSNGVNHLQNEAIDIIFVSRSSSNQPLTDPSFNYARSVLVWKIAYSASQLLRDVAICIEDDHLHFHKHDGTKINLQSVTGKQRESLNPNTQFFCDGKHAKIQDITDICKILFNNKP